MSNYKSSVWHVFGSVALCCGLFSANFAPFAVARTHQDASFEKFSDKSTQSIIHAILDAENHRRAADDIFSLALHHRNADIRALAVLALGRIGDQTQVEKVLSRLADSNIGVRSQASFALGLLGGDLALQALLQRLPLESSARVRRELFLALGRLGTIQDLEHLQSGLSEAAARTRAGAAQGLGILFSRNPIEFAVPPATLTRLITIATTASSAATPAAFALARYKGLYSDEQESDLIASFKSAPTKTAQAFLARAVAKLKTGQALSALAAMITDGEQRHSGVRIECVRAIATFPVSAASLESLATALTDRSVSVVAQSLESIRSQGVAAASLTGAVQDVFAASGSAWLRGSALETLAVLMPERARALVMDVLSQESVQASVLVASALRALGSLGDAVALMQVLPYLDHRQLVLAAAAAEAVVRFADTLLNEHAKEPLRRVLQRHDLALTAQVSEIAVRNDWRDFAVNLAESYTFFNRPDDIEGKVAILNALAKLGDQRQLTLIEAALGDPDRGVALAAAQAYEALTGTSVMDRVPPTTAVVATTPSLSELRAACDARVLLVTTKGEVELSMLDVAPLTAHNFTKLVSRGFYDHLSFHRVVPNFVVQGGDPRGDGYGGPGYLIRDEVSLMSHERGMVGMASAGKDTAGSQIFINHAPNLHLDANYTIFAQVTRGMAVVDRLEVGDLILRAELIR